MDTISMLDDDPTLPIDFDHSTNIANFLQRDKMDSSDSKRGSLFSPEESTSEAGAIPSLPANNEPNTPERGTLREHEEIISTFKKENFGLKLRIYFLEERLQMAYEEDTEDVLKTNIELKVNIEQLKKEVTDKQQLLIKASKAMETITVESERHIEKIKDEFTKQYDEMVNELQQEVESRDKELQENENSVKSLNEKLAKAEKANQELEENLRSINDSPKIVEELKLKQQEIEEKHEIEMQEKDLKIKELVERKSNEDAQNEIKELGEKLAEKEKEIQSLQEELKDVASKSFDRASNHYEVLYNKLEVENIENEKKMKELTKDLKKKADLVEELKDYINRTDRVNKELRNSIHNKETEKHRSSTSLQEHIRRIDLALTNKEKEVNRCHAQIEKLEKLNQKLEKEAKRNQRTDENGSPGKHEAVATLKADLREKEILLKKMKQAIDDKDKELVYFNNAKMKAEQDFENGSAQKNLEIQGINEQLKKLGDASKNRLKSWEDRCQKLQEDSQLQLNNKDRTIQRLANALRKKDILIEELIAPQDSTDCGPESPQDMSSMANFIKKLRGKLKDMDQMVEKTLDEKFKLIDEKDKVILELKRILRGNDHEMELLKANVVSCEGLIKHQEGTSDEKDKTMQDLRSALEVQENSFKVSRETAANDLEYCRMEVLKLSRLHEAKEAEIKEMQKTFTKPGEGSLKMIHDQLDARNKLNQELAMERDTAVNRNEINKQKFISALNSKDAQIRDAFTRMGRLTEEKNEAIKRLKTAVEQKSEDIKLLEKKLSESNSASDVLEERHQKNAIDKDHAIEDLAKSGLEKDRLISELQERLNLTPKGNAHVIPKEMELLKEKLQNASEDLDQKTDELSGLRLDNKHLQERLNEMRKAENIEITMKFDNLRSELEEKDRNLKEARDEVSVFQQEMKQIASLSESLQKKIRALEKEKDAKTEEIEDLKELCRRKDVSINEMKKEVNENREIGETLRKLKGQKDKLEGRLSALQAEIETLQSKKGALEKKLSEADIATIGLERRLEQSKCKNESMALAVEDLKRENNELKSEVERGCQVPQRKSEPVGAGVDEIDSKELRHLLKVLMEEQKKIFEAAEKEKSQYLKLIHELQNKGELLENPNLDVELQSINALKSQYESSLRQNDTLNRLLESESRSLRESFLKSSCSLQSSQTEVENLKRKLEESENWNRSLQSRLDELLPRAGGVGGSVDTVDGNPPVNKAAFEKLKKDCDSLKDELLEQKKATQDLQQQLQEKSRELEDARKRLTEMKAHYEKIIQLRGREIATITENCEQAQRVIKEFEEQISSLGRELQRVKGGQGRASGDLKKQMDGINSVNDILRKTLNEKIEELKESNDKLAHQDEQCMKLEQKSNSLSEEKSILLRQIQEKNVTVGEMKKEMESVKLELEKSKEGHLKKARELESLQKDKQELRNMNERLRKSLDDVSRTYESLKETSEQGNAGLRAEMQMTEAIIDRLRQENEETNSVNMRLRDEIKDLQESSRKVQLLANELKGSQNVNKALQKQLNALAESSETRKNALEPEVDRLNRRVGELLESTSAAEQKLRFYERQAGALQEEYRHEKHMFDSEKKALLTEADVLKKEIADASKVKENMESTMKQVLYESEAYKSMIERLESDNLTKKNIVSKLKAELDRKTHLVDGSTAMTPQKNSGQTLPMTPERLMSALESMTKREEFLKEALQKRDGHIESLKKELESYKEEKGRGELASKKKADDDNSKSNNLIALHISEMRELRKELEQSIQNNNALRDHLEHRLSEAEKEAEKLKDPKVRATLLRENDNLRAKIAEQDLKMKELGSLNDKLRGDGQRSSGLVVERDALIKQLKRKLEDRRTENDRMKAFVPQETSSTATSPTRSIEQVTQTTPRKLSSMRSKEVQVDTILAKSLAEKEQLAERLRVAESSLEEKEGFIKETGQRNEKQVDEMFRRIVSMKAEILELNATVGNKDLTIRELEMRMKELEATLSTKDSQSSEDAEKKSANDELIALHISEMQKLKKELELSIRNNENLKSQLEHRLSMVEKDAEKIKDPRLRVNVIRDNDLLRSQSIERQNAVARLQGVIDQLMAEKNSDKECIKKLHQQMHNLNKVTANLKDEVKLYDRLQQQLSESAARNQAKSNSPDSAASEDAVSAPKSDASLLQLLLEEIRNLRVQLQKSIDANMALKERLEEQLGASLSTSGFSSPANTATNNKEIDDAKGNTVRRALFSSFALNQSGNTQQQGSHKETPTKENGSPGSRSHFLSPGSLAAVVNEASNKNLFVRGKLEDFVLLKSKLATCFQRLVVMQDVHLILQKQKHMTGHQMTELKEEVDRISADLKECRRLAELVWIEENPTTEESKENPVNHENYQLKAEVEGLKKRLLSQEKLIKTSLLRLEESNKVKEDLEHQILEKLKATRGTMMKASQNLEDKIVKSKTPPKQSRRSGEDAATLRAKSK